MPVELAPDRRHDPAQVAQGPDERAAGGAELVADRDLQVAVALGQQVEGEDLGVVVVVDDLGVGRGRPRQGPEAALAVADRGPGHEPEQAGEGQVAEAALGQHAPDLAREPGADHVVGPPLQDGADQPLQLGRVVLAVGVAEGDRGRPPLDGGGQARPDGRPQPPVGRRREHGRAGRRRPARRCGRRSRRRPPGTRPGGRAPAPGTRATTSATVASSSWAGRNTTTGPGPAAGPWPGGRGGAGRRMAMSGGSLPGLGRRRADD